MNIDMEPSIAKPDITSIPGDAVMKAAQIQQRTEMQERIERDTFLLVASVFAVVLTWGQAENIGYGFAQLMFYVHGLLVRVQHAVEQFRSDPDIPKWIIYGLTELYTSNRHRVMRVLNWIDIPENCHWLTGVFIIVFVFTLVCTFRIRSAHTPRL